MNYYKFFISNRKILAFAIILTFFSGFGQTFLLSLYIPSIIADFQISPSLYSAIYAVATLCSGIAIIFAGKLIDRMPLQRFTMIVVVGIIAANLLAGITRSVVLLFLAIFMLRFFGQGLLSHTSMTAMGRYFNQARGKALSIAYLGFPLAEAIFPIVVVSLILTLGWRESFMASAIFIAVVLTPLVIILLRNFDKSKVVETYDENINATVSHSEPQEERAWAQREIIRTPDFYIFAPTVFIVGFTLTALFFYQIFIAEFKDWTVEWMALNITAYAASSFVFSIIAGPLTDRFSARKLFPFVLLPMLAGLLALALFTHPLTVTLYWALVGITAGANPTISNALYAETYGVKSLGSIRSIFTFVMIISTAMGPVVYSQLINAGLNYNHIHLLISGVVILNILFVLVALKKSRAGKR